MEYSFGKTCKELANLFTKLADAYEEDKQIAKARLDLHERELEHNNETKRKILAVLQEDLSGI